MTGYSRGSITSRTLQGQGRGGEGGRGLRKLRQEDCNPTLGV